MGHDTTADAAVRSPGGSASAGGAAARRAEAQRLLGRPRAELDELYRGLSAGAIPVGDTSGICVFKPGTLLARPTAVFARLCLWQGKVFDPLRGELVNKISPLRIKGIRAKVYEGESWLDQKPAIIIDYSQTSFVAKRIRDEIRQVSEGLYLGKVYWGRSRMFVDFMLVL